MTADATLTNRSDDAGCVPAQRRLRESTSAISHGRSGPWKSAVMILGCIDATLRMNEQTPMGVSTLKDNPASSHYVIDVSLI
jgi:hypothetical protein